MDGRKLGVLEFLEAGAAGLRSAYCGARGLVRHPERHSPLHQPFGDVGGQGVAERGQFGHPVDVETQRRDQARHRGQQQLELKDGVEHRLLVLLQVPVVRQRLSLQRRQQAGEVADQPTRFAASQFRDVGVLLLRHDRASRRPRVVQRHVAEFGGAPEDDVFGQPGQINPDH